MIADSVSFANSPALRVKMSWLSHVLRRELSLDSCLGRAFLGLPEEPTMYANFAN
jgi:hypothetical protein